MPKLDRQPCEGRRAIEERLAHAVREVYRVKALVKSGDSDSAALTLARQEERDTKRDLRAHIEQHRCKKP